MWFTFAFFSIPVAIFLLYKGLTVSNKNSKAKILWAIVLILIPIILGYIEKKNVEEIQKDLIGTFYFKDTTLILNQNKAFLLINLDSIIERGQWEFNTNDRLIVSLKDNDNVTELELIYKNGLPILKTDPYDSKIGDGKFFIKK